MLQGQWAVGIYRAKPADVIHFKLRSLCWMAVRDELKTSEFSEWDLFQNPSLYKCSPVKNKSKLLFSIIHVVFIHMVTDINSVSNALKDSIFHDNIKKSFSDIFGALSLSIPFTFLGVWFVCFNLFTRPNVQHTIV